MKAWPIMASSYEKAITKALTVSLVLLVIIVAVGGTSYYYLNLTAPQPKEPTPLPTATLTLEPTLAPPTIEPTSEPPTSAPIEWKLVNLVQAVYQELVDLTTSGDGLEEVDLTLKSKSNDPLEVTIEPGTMFQAQSSNVQNMVVIAKKIVYLESPDDIISDTIDVACAAMDLAAPQKTDTFTVSNAPAKEDLIKLLNLPAFANETFRIKQFAIWTITDNPPRGEYVGLGYFGLGSGPNDEEMSRIKTLFENAGVSTSSYQALTLVEPAPTTATTTVVPTAAPSVAPTVTPIPVPTIAPTPVPTAAPTSSPAPVKLSLSDAISNGYVLANITGKDLGASSGDSIVLSIQSLVSHPIEIELIPQGTILLASGDYQNMAVQSLRGLRSLSGYYPRDKIVLDASSKASYLFSGYCVNFEKENPTIITRFTISGVDPTIAKIFSVVNPPTSVAEVNAIQTAIFAVTDNISKGDLQERYPEGVAQIPNAKAILEKAGIDGSAKQLFK